jgi:hypothetical protein
MDKPEYTHILVFFKSQNVDYLYRATDGVRIGQRKDTTVIFGEEPNKCQGRVFVDMDYAARWLASEVPYQDLKARGIDTDVFIDIRNGEPLVELPANSLQLPGVLTRMN